jgi:hypothetical protein
MNYRINESVRGLFRPLIYSLTLLLTTLFSTASEPLISTYQNSLSLSFANTNTLASNLLAGTSITLAFGSNGVCTISATGGGFAQTNDLTKVDVQSGFANKMWSTNPSFSGIITQAGTGIKFTGASSTWRDSNGTSRIIVLPAAAGGAITLRDANNVEQFMVQSNGGVRVIAALASRAAIFDSQTNLTNCAGTPDGTKFLRDDNTLATPVDLTRIPIQSGFANLLTETNTTVQIFLTVNGDASFLSNLFAPRIVITNTLGLGSTQVYLSAFATNYLRIITSPTNNAIMGDQGNRRATEWWSDGSENAGGTNFNFAWVGYDPASDSGLAGQFGLRGLAGTNYGNVAGFHIEDVAIHNNFNDNRLWALRFKDPVGGAGTTGGVYMVMRAQNSGGKNWQSDNYNSVVAVDEYGCWYSGCLGREADNLTTVLHAPGWNNFIARTNSKPLIFLSWSNLCATVYPGALENDGENLWFSNTNNQRTVLVKPTNSPTDGFVVTATGTAGDAAWKAAAAGGGSPPYTNATFYSSTNNTIATNAVPFSVQSVAGMWTNTFEITSNGTVLAMFRSNGNLTLPMGDDNSPAISWGPERKSGISGNASGGSVQGIVVIGNGGEKCVITGTAICEVNTGYIGFNSSVGSSPFTGFTSDAAGILAFRTAVAGRGYTNRIYGNSFGAASVTNATFLDSGYDGANGWFFMRVQTNHTGSADSTNAPLVLGVGTNQDFTINTNHDAQVNHVLWIGTNTIAGPTPLAGMGGLWNSNKVLYWVTETKTNLLNDGR